MDSALARASDNGLRLAHAQGSLWHGSGWLASVESDGLYRAFLPLGWRFEPAALLGGEIVWQLGEPGLPPARLSASLDGLRLEGLDFALPLRALARAIPHAAARAGWRGDLRLEVPSLRCSWRQACDGRATLLWRNAGLDIVPSQRFGDYRLDGAIDAGHLDFAITTLSGEIHVQGHGSGNPARPQFNGEVRGPAEIIDRLPNILDGIATRSGESGRVWIRVR